MFWNAQFSPKPIWEIYHRTCDYLSRTGAGEEIERLGTVFRLTRKVLPEQIEQVWSGHLFPWDECYGDLQISFAQASYGLFKPAYYLLRSALELGLLLVYWKMDDSDPEAWKGWLRSTDSTPRACTIWKRVMGHANFQAFQRTYDLDSDYASFSALSDYVHTKGMKYSNAVRLPGSSIRVPGFSPCFSEEAFDEWRSRFKSTVRFLCMCFLVRYPIGTVRFDWVRKFGIDIPAFGGLSDTDICQLEELITPEVFRAISAIAPHDDHVAEVMNWVNGLPDLSDEVNDEQVIELYKTLMNPNQIAEWIAIQRKIIERARVEGISTARKEAIVSHIADWARDRGVELV
jgi:hypothetical protein